MFDSAVRVTRSDEQQRAKQEQAAKALTVVMMGFALQKPGSLAAWLRAEREIGLFDNWFTLPCDIVCCLDPMRLARACSGTLTPP